MGDWQEFVRTNVVNLRNTSLPHGNNGGRNKNHDFFKYAYENWIQE